MPLGLAFTKVDGIAFFFHDGVGWVRFVFFSSMTSNEVLTLEDTLCVCYVNEALEMDFTGHGKV